MGSKAPQSREQYEAEHERHPFWLGFTDWRFIFAGIVAGVLIVLIVWMAK